MSKLIFIGLAAAALGVGGIALPSGDNNDASTEATSADFVATASAAQPVAALAAAVSGPFDRSAELCATGQYVCISFARPATVSEILRRPESWERARILNGWTHGEVSLDTVVPARTEIVYKVRS